jgi:hypothetical protein
MYQDKYGKAPSSDSGPKIEEVTGEEAQMIDTTSGDEAPALEEVDMDEFRRDEQMKKLAEQIVANEDKDQEEELDAEAKKEKEDQEMMDELNKATELEMEKA